MIKLNFTKEQAGKAVNTYNLKYAQDWLALYAEIERLKKLIDSVVFKEDQMNKLNLTYPITGLQINQQRLIEDANALHAEVERLEKLLDISDTLVRGVNKVNDRLTQSLKDVVGEIDNYKLDCQHNSAKQEEGDNVYAHYFDCTNDLLDILRKHFPKELGGKE